MTLLKKKWMRRISPGVGDKVPHVYINETDPSYYEKLLRFNRHNVKALYQLGRTCEKSGHFERARSYYEKAISIQPYEPAVGALLLLRRKEQWLEIQREHKKKEAALMSKKWGAQRKQATRSKFVQSIIITLLIYLIAIILTFGVVLN
ncbi:tetratricopeptide repeat protein [Aneurinibacillus terranovensis]|uniref:tetratricopeptide repeat protein n=1 Tax=Aneurinibacillus terranovensis TaxID=278991 RepID=UPI00041B96C4|nr:tetratricopeptide repeat protein [Aneurinibacillus terranovensis]